MTFGILALGFKSFDLASLCFILNIGLIFCLDTALHWACCTKSAKNDAIRKLNECQSKHYIFFHSSGGHVYRLGYFLQTQLYEVEFVFRHNEKFRRFLFIQVGKVSKLFKNENIHLEKFWPHYDIDNTILLRKIGSNTLTLEGPWKVTLNDKSVYPKHCKISRS